MELAEKWHDLYTLRYVPITFIQVVSAAGTIFILSGVQAASGTRVAHAALDTARAKTKKAIQFLQEVGKSFVSAQGIADILAHLLVEQVDARLMRRAGVRWQPDSSPPYDHSVQGSPGYSSGSRSSSHIDDAAAPTSEPIGLLSIPQPPSSGSAFYDPGPFVASSVDVPSLQPVEFTFDGLQDNDLGFAAMNTDVYWGDSFSDIPFRMFDHHTEHHIGFSQSVQSTDVSFTNEQMLQRGSQQYLWPPM